MKNREVADRLYEIADFLDIQEVEFKPRAYRRAARNIESLSEDIEDIHDRGELEDIEGVGESIAEKIAEFLETGEMEYHRELKTDLPIDIEAITSVEGVGPKTAKKLYQALDIRSLEDLEAAAKAGEIATVEGFGEKSQQNILEHIEMAKHSQERMLIGKAFPTARAIERRLSESEAFDRVDIVGSFRRRRPTVGDIDILATAPDHEAAMEAFCTHDDVKEVLGRGQTKGSVIVSGDLQMDLRLVDASEYGAALIYFTGSKDHNITLRNRAIERNWKLNEYGLFDVSDVEADDGQRVGERLASETETKVYGALDLEWIPPELREDTGEVEAAAGGELPELIELDDVRGDLQMHTTYSDGSGSVRDMAEAADKRGLEYILITDHGPGAPIPSKLDDESFEAFREDVEDVNMDDDIGVEVLCGVEAEIGEDGIGMPDAWADQCDLVVAGMHGRVSDATERILRAIENDPIDILAHPTNRLINEREPLDIDLSAVADVAVEENIALEINGQPSRLDLDWQYVKEFRNDVAFVTSTDAHGPPALDLMHLAVSVARRGWCEAENVLNTQPIDELRDALE